MPQIPVSQIINTQHENQFPQHKQLLKPIPRDVTQLTKSYKNYQSQNEAQIEKAKLSSTLNVTKHKNRIHCKTNFLDQKTLINPEILHSEHKKAAQLAHVGDFIKRTQDDSQGLELSTTDLFFTNFIPFNNYSQNIIITNTSKTSRRISILPPKQPFQTSKLAANLIPGGNFILTVNFHPTSHGIFSSEIEIRSGKSVQLCSIQAKNNPGNIKIDQIFLNEKPINAEISTTTQLNQITFTVNIADINKTYSTPHNCRILLRNDPVLIPQKTSSYSQFPPFSLQQNALRIQSVDISSETNDLLIDLFVSNENSVNCDFVQIYEQKPPEIAQNVSKLQDFLLFNKKFFFDQFEIQQAKQPEQPHFEILFNSNGVLALEMDFFDELRSGITHQITINTLENYQILINFTANVVDSYCKLAQIDEKTTNFIAKIDFQDAGFTEIYDKKRLPKDRILQIQSEITTQKSILREIILEFDGIERDNLQVQLRYFKENLALGYISELCGGFESDNFRFLDEKVGEKSTKVKILFNFELGSQYTELSQNHSISDYLHKSKLQPPQVLKSILDVNFVLNYKNYTLFRVILVLIPKFPSLSNQILKNHNLSIKNAISFLQNQSTPLTDYLLISEPSLDLQVIPVQSGAEFKFKVKNCSKTCFIPFIVSTNLHCSSSNLVTTPFDTGVHFRWQKANETISSDVQFSDVCDVFNLGLQKNLYDNLNKEIPQNYQPQYLKQINTNSSRQKSFSDEPEPIMSFPHAGIIPPQESITIHIKVRPLSLGPIEAFIVINTPSTHYYEKILAKIHEKVRSHENSHDESERKASQSSQRSNANNSGRSDIRKTPILTPLSQIRPSTSLQQFQQISANPFLSFSDSTLHYKSSSLKLFEQLRDKAIPVTEMQRLFLPFQDQVYMEGGFLSERDVCCRVYGTVAAPMVEFEKSVFAPENDMLQPVEIRIFNKGKTSVSVNLKVLEGDASFLDQDDIPKQLAPAALAVWFRQRLQQVDFTIEMELNEVKTVLMLPGLIDSIIVCKKSIQSFGMMMAQMNQDLVDSENNIVIAATKLLKRLEPLKPYVYLEVFKTSFEILNPENVTIPDYQIQTRPYHPITVPFTIVNPSSTTFTCEIAIGQDLIAPQIVKVPPQSKVNANFAINPDRSGDIESFIQFHDANMRIYVSSFGPDVSIRCPFVQNFQNLHIKQGMIRQNDRNEEIQGHSWEKLLNEIPMQLEIMELEVSDFQMKYAQMMSSRQNKFVQQQIPMDLTELNNKSVYDDILQEMPYLILQNQGSTQSKSINITIHNPTGSSMLIKPKISPLNKTFLKLSVNFNESQNQIQLMPGGLFSNKQILDTPYFVCSPTETEIVSMKQVQISIKATNMKKFGTYEGILQLNGIFIRLKCEREPPKINFCDGAKSLIFETNFKHNYTQSLNIVSYCQSHLQVEIETEFPFKLEKSQIQVDALSRIEFNLCLMKEDVLNYFNFNEVDKNASIDQIILNELQFKQILSKIVLKIQNVDQIPYEMSFPIQANISAPELYPRSQILTFKNTFPRKEDISFFKLENSSVLPANFTIFHVDIKQFLTLNNDFSEIFNVEELDEISANSQQKYAKKVTQSCQKTFTDFNNIYYDESQDTVIIDDPSHFEFNVLKGTIQGHENKKPYKNMELGVRFAPQDESFDMTRDRVFKCQYRSVFYVKVDGGKGSWIGCQGGVNINIDEV